MHLLRVEDRTLTYNGLLLYIVTWMESCLIGTLTAFSYIYMYGMVFIWSLEDMKNTKHHINKRCVCVLSTRYNWFIIHPFLVTGCKWGRKCIKADEIVEKDCLKYKCHIEYSTDDWGVKHINRHVRLESKGTCNNWIGVFVESFHLLIYGLASLNIVCIHQDKQQCTIQQKTLSYFSF